MIHLFTPREPTFGKGGLFFKSNYNAYGSGITPSKALTTNQLTLYNSKGDIVRSTKDDKKEVEDTEDYDEVDDDSEDELITIYEDVGEKKIPYLSPVKNYKLTIADNNIKIVKIETDSKKFNSTFYDSLYNKYNYKNYIIALKYKDNKIYELIIPVAKIYGISEIFENNTYSKIKQSLEDLAKKESKRKKIDNDTKYYFFDFLNVLLDYMFIIDINKNLATEIVKELKNLKGKLESDWVESIINSYENYLFYKLDVVKSSIKKYIDLFFDSKIETFEDLLKYLKKINDLKDLLVYDKDDEDNIFNNESGEKIYLTLNTLNDILTTNKKKTIKYIKTDFIQEYKDLQDKIKTHLGIKTKAELLAEEKERERIEKELLAGETQGQNKGKNKQKVVQSTVATAGAADTLKGNNKGKKKGKVVQSTVATAGVADTLKEEVKVEEVKKPELVKSNFSQSIVSISEISTAVENLSNKKKVELGIAFEKYIETKKLINEQNNTIINFSEYDRIDSVKSGTLEIGFIYDFIKNNGKNKGFVELKYYDKAKEFYLMNIKLEGSSYYRPYFKYDNGKLRIYNILDINKGTWVYKNIKNYKLDFIVLLETGIFKYSVENDDRFFSTSPDVNKYLEEETINGIKLFKFNIKDFVNVQHFGKCLKIDSSKLEELYIKK